MSDLPEPTDEQLVYTGPQRVFSGIQPTGNLHLGNYLGAIKRWVDMQAEFECVYCIVDLHAITVWQDPAALRQSTLELAAALIASGIDPRQNVLFNQSQVLQHAELAWIFTCVARIGWMTRMTQFKEKTGKHRENASLGLLAYPALMAADILAYKGTHVPVGEDQKQHVELARNIAQKFNHDFDVPGFFPLPEPLIEGAGTRVMSLRDGSKKMSKSDTSDYSRINLTDDADTIAQKIRKARTDPEPVPASDAALFERPEAANLIKIYAGLADASVADVLVSHGGQPFAQFKEALTELAVAKIGPLSQEMRRLMEDREELLRLLAEGAERARAVSEPVLADVRRVVGFVG